ncbi:MAG: hypothetical protein LC785_15595 [Acidobacteria bacterium]|nr:hypothetical protein [Acidobacteriota bacterium]MCA1643330.1 hypothetical protein [Acidobacteriota bacterium]
MRKICASVIAVMFILPASARQAGAAGQGDEGQRAAAVKARVERIGTGVKARVTVTTKDGMKLKGIVTQIGEGSFVVVRTDGYLGQSVTLAYSDVSGLKGGGVSWQGVGSKTAAGALFAFAILREIAKGVRVPAP